eukprot:scaffold217821_cov30-Tisochrysis_lutea.AAC.1
MSMDCGRKVVRVHPDEQAAELMACGVDSAEGQKSRTSPQSSTMRAPSSHSSSKILACHCLIPYRSLSSCLSTTNRAPSAHRVRVYTALRRFPCASERPHNLGGCRPSSPAHGAPHSEASRKRCVFGVEPKALVHWQTPAWSAKYVECMHRIAQLSVLAGGRTTACCHPGMSCSPLSAGISAKQPI